MVKVKDVLTDISLTIGIISGILAISEKLTNWNVLALVYPLVDQTQLFLILVVVAFVSLAVYVFRIRKRHFAFFGGTSERPSSLSTRDSYDETYYDVRWRVYPPASRSGNRRAWVEGPYCPKCKRELEETTTGTLRKKPVWVCPDCETEYERPKGDAKEEVRKDFEAYLRRKGEL